MPTASLLLLHLHSFPSPRPPPWPSFYPLTNRPPLSPLPISKTSTSLTPPQFCSRFFAIRSRKFDYGDFKFDATGSGSAGDFGRRRKMRRRRSDKRSKQRKWWTVEEDRLRQEPRSGILKQVINSVWIFKVLTSYGWFLPIIIPSLLIATGPKAFLMAFSLPLGFSLVILVIQKLGEWLDVDRNPRQRRQRRSPFSRGIGALMEDEDDEEEDIEEEIQQKRRSRNRDYRSWVVGRTGSVHKGNSSSRASASSFGGWDELVTEEETGGARSSSEMSAPEALTEETKFNRSLQDRDLPLLLRFLVALFPFLGAWTNLL